MSKYDDIINLPHHVSATRKPMPLENRATQFAPFAALSGHEDAIAETARITAEKPELSAEELERLSRRLGYAIEKGAEISIVYFQPDSHKQGGYYNNIRGKVKKLDEINGQIIFSDHCAIPFDCVMSIEGEIFDDIEF